MSVLVSFVACVLVGIVALSLAAAHSAEQSADHGSIDVVRTPYGEIPAECVISVPSGTLITQPPNANSNRDELDDIAATAHNRADPPLVLQFADHTETVISEPSPCAFVRDAAHGRPVLSWPQTLLQLSSTEDGIRSRNRSHNYHKRTPQDAPDWDGWAQHWWFGLDYASWSRHPLQDDVEVLSANWMVPAPPFNTSGNPEAPWTAAPTLSAWIGLQDVGSLAVLQPVLEFNAFFPSQWDVTSWNCCPQGYVFHSTPLLVQPGAQIFGTIQQNNTNDTLVYDVITSVAGVQTSLHADMRALNQWSPRWAEVTIEGYFVTHCNQLPSQPVSFSNFTLQTAKGGLNPNPPLAFNENTPPQWTPDHNSNVSAPCNPAATQYNSEDVAIGFGGGVCELTLIPTPAVGVVGFSLFNGAFTISEALRECSASAACAVVSFYSTNSHPPGQLFVSAFTNPATVTAPGWWSYIKKCKPWPYNGN